MPTTAQIAYRRWEEAGRPAGRSDEFWRLAEKEAPFRPKCPCKECCATNVWADRTGKSFVDDHLKLSHFGLK